MVAGCLAGGIGAVRFVAVGFAERRLILGERAIHFVGRDMQKTEAVFLFGSKPRPVGAHRLQQMESADDVGLDEIFRSVNGTVHMTLGRKIDYRAGAVFGEQLVQHRRIADIAAHEDVA